LKAFFFDSGINICFVKSSRRILCDFYFVLPSVFSYSILIRPASEVLKNITVDAQFLTSLNTNPWFWLYNQESQSELCDCHLFSVLCLNCICFRFWNTWSSSVNESDHPPLTSVMNACVALQMSKLVTLKKMQRLVPCWTSSLEHKSFFRGWSHWLRHHSPRVLHLSVKWRGNGFSLHRR